MTCWWRRDGGTEALAAYRTEPRDRRDSSPPPTPATPSGSATCRSATTGSATCWWRRGDATEALAAYRTEPGDRRDTRRRRSGQHAVAARPVDQPREDRRRAGGSRAAGRMRWRPTAGATRSARHSPPPIPATPSGSATCRLATTGSATCWWRLGERAEALAEYRTEPGDSRNTRRRRSRQHTVAARPVDQPH